MFFSTSVNSEYPAHAELAAQLERDGMYSNAAFTWMAAAHHARKPENSHWAESRADFCNTWAQRYQRSSVT